MDLYEEMKWVSLSVQCDQPGFQDFSLGFWAEKPCSPKAKGEVLITRLPKDLCFFFNILLSRPTASILNKYKWLWLVPIIKKHIMSLPFLSNSLVLRAKHLMISFGVNERRRKLATCAFSGRKKKRKAVKSKACSQMRFKKLCRGRKIRWVVLTRAAHCLAQEAETAN